MLVWKLGYYHYFTEGKRNPTAMAALSPQPRPKPAKGTDATQPNTGSTGGKK